MELVKAGEKTYYIKNATNIGIYKVNENEVYLIDAGNDKDAGKKILKIVAEQGWIVKGIIATHSNADHIGGCKVIQDRTGCEVLAHGMEGCFTKYPVLEPSFLYGGYPFKDLKNKFLLAQGVEVKPLDENLPEGLEYFSLKGHFFDMVGIRTSDDVYFLGDSLFSEETISKYHLFFVYDVREFLNTLEYLKNMKGVLFIPAHCEATEDISELVLSNEEKVHEVLDKICELCTDGRTFEGILKSVFEEYKLKMDANQYVLVGSTVRSYLSYLCDEGKIGYEFRNNEMVWRVIEEGV